MKLSKFLTGALCAMTLVLGMQNNANAAYPNKPIKIVVASTAGSGVDLFTRQMSTLLSKELGVDIVIVNKAAGNVAVNELTKARKDGYTLGVIGTPAYTTSHFFSKVNYKFDDIIPLSQVTSTAFGLFANGSSPWNNFNDVVKTAKAENRPILVGSFNTDMRLTLESLAEVSGIKFTLVPMQGAAPMIPAVMGGHIELACVGTAFVDTAKAGSTKFLGAVSSAPFKDFPNVQTITNQGYDFLTLQSATYFTATKGTPDDVLATLEAAIVKITKSPEYAKILETLGFDMPSNIGRKDATANLTELYEHARQAKALEDASK